MKLSSKLFSFLTNFPSFESSGKMFFQRLLLKRDLPILSFFSFFPALIALRRKEIKERKSKVAGKEEEKSIHFVKLSFVLSQERVSASIFSFSLFSSFFPKFVSFPYIVGLSLSLQERIERSESRKY